MTRELLNANITHISYVDKGANQKKFFLTKSANPPEPVFEKQVKIVTKAEDEQQLVYGVVYEPDAIDAHDDTMNAAEIEKAAHAFMKDYRNIDTQHNFEAGAGELVESYIAPADMQVGEETITKGSWVIVTKADDATWEAIKKGEFTGYSMAGTAETIEKQATQAAVPSNPEETGLFNLLKNFFTGEKVEKGELRDNYAGQQKRRNLWAAYDGLESIFFGSLWDNHTPEVADFERLEAAAAEFLEIVQEIKTAGDVAKALEGKPEVIQKAGKKISTANMKKIKAAHEALDDLITANEEGDDDVKKEELEKAISDALEPVTNRLAELEKGSEPKSDEQDDVAKQVGEAITAALEPVTARLEAVEKARGISKQQQEEQQPDDTQIQKSTWDGLL